MKFSILGRFIKNQTQFRILKAPQSSHVQAPFVLFLISRRIRSNEMQDSAVSFLGATSGTLPE